MNKSTSKRQLILDEVSKDLQAVVGPDRVTTDPVVCQSYSGRGYAREQMLYLGLCTRPACVVLPHTTEEVARIVRICYRYGVPYVPASTLWVIQSAPRFRDDFVLIDLKRMDEMTIDERNMYAVVGPGIVYGQLLEEAMRRDLYTIAPGGGSQVSVIANHLFCGMCPLCYRIPLSDRRINAAEWVTPEGDIVRLGSFASGEENWFWQDGLGPNAAGVLRGHIGWAGGLGIVTRMSVKLYPFQPQHMEPEGISPDTHSVLPSRMRFYNFSMPNNEALVRAMDELARAQIGAAITKVPVSWRVIAKAQDRNEFWQEWANMTEAEIARTHVLRVLLIGYTSQKQIEYEEKVLMDIVVTELGGILRRTRQTDQSLLKMSDAAGMWMMTGGYMSNTAGVDSLRTCAEVGPQLGKRMLDFSPPLMPQYNDPGWFQATEFGHQYYLEIPAYMDPDRLDPRSPKYSKADTARVMEWYMSAVPEIENRNGFFCIFDGQHEPLKLKGPAWHNYDVWVRRFKETFDPKWLSNPPQPFEVDETVERFPEFVTPESEQETARIARIGETRSPAN